MDVFLSEIPEIASRSQAAQLIKGKYVKKGDVALKPSYIVEEGDLLDVSIIEPDEPSLNPYNFPLDIFFEDEQIIIVNKPAGLVVHPSAGHGSDTLVNAILNHTSELSAGFDTLRPGIIHRLDKDTSGLLVVAKTKLAQDKLSRQFQSREVERVYWAICFGRFKEKQGRISTHLGRHPRNRKKFASLEKGGKEAITNFKVLAEDSCFSLVRLKLETGRTHQIRVHLSELGHPIVGDSLYGGDKRIASIPSTELRKTVKSMDRFALHAARLGIIHPTTGQKLEFEVGWPDELLFLAERFV